MYVAVSDHSDGTANVRPNHIDPGCTLPSLSTLPSVNKTIAPSTRIVPLNSKPLFQDSEDKCKAMELGDKVLENTEDLGETNTKAKPWTVRVHGSRFTLGLNVVFKIQVLL